MYGGNEDFVGIYMGNVYGQVVLGKFNHGWCNR